MDQHNASSWRLQKGSGLLTAKVKRDRLMMPSLEGHHITAWIPVTITEESAQLFADVLIAYAKRLSQKRVESPPT